MKNYLFIDTETTGFKKAGPKIQEGQGRVCQVAMILANEERRILSEFSTLIKPDGWSIQDGANKIHGISDEDCEQFGLSQQSVVRYYAHAVGLADVIVAHNEEFDRAMMEIELAYYNDNDGCGEVAVNYEPWFCTMKRNTHINRTGRWPKLDATLQHYCNKSLGDTAHDAMADTRACVDIFFEMKKRGDIK